MNLPIQHHYLSEFHLLGFTDENGGLSVFDKLRGDVGIRRSTPKKEFTQRHLNTFTIQDGTKNVDLERWYAKEIEAPAALVVKKLITAARLHEAPSVLTFDERSDWLNFVNHQRKRPPDAFERVGCLQDIARQVAEAIARLENKVGRALTAEERAIVESPDGKKRMIQQAKIGARGDGSKIVLDVLANKGLALGLVKKPNKSFIFGDYPFVKAGRSVELADPQTEYWVPIASDVIVGSVGEVGRDYFTIISADQVRMINKVIFKQSNKLAARSEMLIRSLARL